MKIKPVLADKKGSALILCLLVMSVLTTIGITALNVSSTNQKISGNYRKQAQAFYIAEAGLQRGIAEIKNDITYRSDTTGNIIIGATTADYAVKICDATNNGEAECAPLIPPGGYIKLISQGNFNDSTQSIETFVTLTPNDGSTADSPYKAVITSGDNTGAGSHVVNGYDDDGNLDTANMVDTHTTLPTVNQEALKTFADFSFSALENSEVDTDLSIQTDFWKDPPTNKKPYIIHVTGNMSVSGNRHIYGIIFVEGNVTMSGAVRVHGVIYAPNASVKTTINGGGNPGDQPVMGQVISGDGGVHASGNHGDVQLVKDYVDAFNNYGGDNVDVNIMAGTWKHY